MKKCPYCSAELLDDAEFCLYCMRQLTEKEAIVTHKTFKKQWLLLAIIPVVFATVLTVLLFGKGNNNKIPTSQKDNSNYSNSESVFENSQNSSNESQNSFDTSSNNSSVSAGDKTQTNSGNSAENTSKETSSGTASETVSNTSSNSSSANSSTSSQSGTSKPSSSSSSASTSSKEETPEHNYVVDPSLFRYEENPTGYTVFGAFSNSLKTEAIIPDTYNGKPITEIGDSAFYTYIDIKIAYIPKTVKKIGYSAFSSCYNLTECVIPEGVEEIDRSAFTDTAIEHLVIPSTVKTFGFLTPFSNMKSKTITMKCVPTTIPINMFGNCELLEKVNLPEGLTYLSSGMFLNCNALKNIDLPNSVVEIRKRAFEDCWRLESINLKNTEKLGDEVFTDCASLKSVTVSKSLKSIGKNVFSGCNSITDIYYSGTKAQWESINKSASWNLNSDSTEVFNDCCIIHCSDGDLKV